MPLSVTVNGQNRVFDDLLPSASLASVIEKMKLKADRVAVERNGEIAPRANWPEIPVNTADKLEIVHFVGGGSGQKQNR